ncbi:hypothetical protein WCD74_01630 [Actinomycetospora sp. OC33-EN08]|uniref:Uncharacterized protein n=1 Tax=Actinomycetospora aurantiaca TaxID=3129233 RepID=A0ABU8MGM5_9PSEU
MRSQPAGSSRDQQLADSGPAREAAAVASALVSASPADVDRKIRQLDNEVQAIYEMLARIEGTQRRHDNRFAEIGTDLTELRGQMSDLREDATAMGTKIDGLDTKVVALDDRVAALDDRVAALDDKVTGLDTKVTSLDSKVAGLDTKLDRVIGLLER